MRELAQFVDALSRFYQNEKPLGTKNLARQIGSIISRSALALSQRSPDCLKDVIKRSKSCLNLLLCGVLIHFGNFVMVTRRSVLKGLGISTIVTGAACVHLAVLNAAESRPGFQKAGYSQKPFAPVSKWADKLIGAAEDQVGKTVNYDGAYTALKYPMGDIPLETGVCTDVVIRAYRQAFDIDLQKLVHEDMRRSFSSYPKFWGLKHPDKNIDHRRVPNLERYFIRQNTAVEIIQNGADYRPGDLVSHRLPGNLPHIGIVSDRPSRDGKRPLLIHNIGSGTKIEDRLFDFKIAGHFRFSPKPA